ncbi:uncharacterized protein LOC115692096 isoform X2 [Syzygium oleosum]|uniref:uncharacterized protein LOC115692096 isoform X2 n=1 Tax=Syzygium oleosum TaxID=219896 RepID=UPI0024B89257|nr:uncharacterized protein LOC115692096 isoform X2 [Syzygium oleosum]
MVRVIPKLMALKQAYAEIILGMAKEAAGRVMAAERRATQFQEELFSSKGEALRLLLRLKQMCDAKLSEAETTSAWQQERIEELEAQLQESENTVKELREELNKARDELENERTHKSHQVSKTLTIGDTVKPEEVLGGNRRNTSRSIGQSQSDSQTADEVSGMNISSNKVSGGSNCSCKGQALKNYCRVHNRNFSVTVMRGKGPKLRRNKGTRTVRAFEKNSSAQLSFSGQEENVEHRTYSRGREGKVSAAVSNLSVDKNYGRKREPSALKMIKADCNEVSKTVTRKRKRTPGCRIKNTSWGKLLDQTFTKQRATDVFSFGTSKESHPPRRLHSPSEATEVMEKSGALVTLKDAELVKPGIMVDATNRSKRPKESENIRQGNGGVQHINVLAATSDQDKINDLSNADLKASSVSDGISGRPLENKLLKFTFTRRKKETLCSPNGTFCGADITSKPKEQKLDHSLKMENSALTCETSQDSQQLVQIAEQLISLARNKWD